MGLNVALSLAYCLRVLEPFYLHAAPGPCLRREPGPLRVAPAALVAGTLLSGALPEPWVALAGGALELLAR